MGKVRVGRRVIETSREDKVLFGDAGITKGELTDYYRRISGTLLHHAKDRPISMHRYPDGLGGEDFYQKKAPDYFPAWIETAQVALREGGSQRQVVLSEAAALVYLADQACITPHVWLSRKGDLDRPDILIFDLDPPDGSFDAVRTAARRVRDALDEIGLVPFLQTTGSRGIHVVSPLRRSWSFDEVRKLAADLAKLLGSRHGDELTTEQRKEKRRGRVFLDYLRNAYAQTAVPPYAVRARPGAPVATPLDWDELGNGDLGPRTYTMGNIFRRLGARDDPWKNMWRRARSLDGPRQKLDRLLEGEKE